MKGIYKPVNAMIVFKPSQPVFYDNEERWHDTCLCAQMTSPDEL